MSNTSTRQYDIFEAAAPRAIASSTNASPIVVTTAAPHGYATGQKVAIIGHLVNTNANGFWEITVTGASTFQLTKNTVTNLISSGNGVGIATGTYVQKPKYAFAADFRNAVLSLISEGTSSMTIKVVGSIQGPNNPPDFAKASSPTNQWTTIQIIDLEDSVAVDGDTGITLAAADVNRTFEVNTNGLMWLSCIITEGTAGELTAKVRLFNNQ